MIVGNFSIPAKTTAILNWKPIFANASPTQSCVSEANSVNNYNLYSKDTNGAGCQAIVVNTGSSAKTVYFGAAYGGAASNFGDLGYVLIKN